MKIVLDGKTEQQVANESVNLEGELQFVRFEAPKLSPAPHGGRQSIYDLLASNFGDLSTTKSINQYIFQKCVN